MVKYRFRRSAVPLVAAAVAASLLLAPSAHAAAPKDAPLPWLTVAHPAGRRAVIVDEAGREVILRGVNVVGLEDDFYTTPSGSEPGTAPIWPIDPKAYVGRCPAMDHHAGEPPLCEVDAARAAFAQSTAAGSRNDFAQMRAFGVNFVRLAVSWSQLEPNPGQYSQIYVDRIAQVVGWARAQGIHVLLDMHQDNYSRYTPQTAPVSAPPLVTPTQEGAEHADGAPPWAVVTDGQPALAPGGQAPFNAYVAASFDSFWQNRVPKGAAQGAPGLQDHYIGAMATLARRFADDSTVTGYEIMNEPLSGSFPPGAFSSAELYPFYRRVIDALTGAGDGAPCPANIPNVPACGYPDLRIHVKRQSFFFEPMAARNLSDAPDQAPLPFSTYPGLVYAPHTYTHVFTVDSIAGVPAGQSPYPLSYDQAYQVADREAQTFGAALISGEYGNSASDDDVILAGETAAQDTALVGSTLWSWKESCGAGRAPKDCAGGWGVYAGDPATPPAQNGPIIPTRVKYASRVVPWATVGRLDSFAYHPTDHSFTMAATASGSSRTPTIVFLPATAKGNVTVAGAAVLDHIARRADGSRVAYVAPTRAGAYTVAVGPS